MSEGGLGYATVADAEEVVDVAIVGGGLAGIAAALRLAESGLSVHLIEAKSRLGGRTGSFSGPESGGSEKTIDYCQHVAMKCNTAMQELIAELGQEEDWRSQETLHFYGPEGKYAPLSQLPLPAPLHIGHWLWRWPGLRVHDRLAIARGMLKIYRLDLSSAELDQISGYDWLKKVGQTQNAIQRFWATIIVSALGEECHRVSLAAVAKVLQDGFMKRRDAFHLLVPERPLDELLNVQARDKLNGLGVDCQMSSPVSRIARAKEGFVVAAKGKDVRAHQVVLALPWYRLTKLQFDLPQSELDVVEKIVAVSTKLESSPITGIHTWWDRPWIDKPHAVIVGRLCQWVFPGPSEGVESNAGEYYYQIVVSASRDLPDANELAGQLVDDLVAVFPAVSHARLLRHRVVTDPKAVFSVGVGTQELRPEAKTGVQGLWLAGDWTQTGWPATMEGAARSGFMVAASIRGESQ